MVNRKIIWTQHAKERFHDRILIYGVSQTEIEEIVKKQEIKIARGFDEKHMKEKFETIGKVWNKFFTIQKAEDSKCLAIITLWESDKKEEEIWNLHKKENAHSAEERQNCEKQQ